MPKFGGLDQITRPRLVDEAWPHLASSVLPLRYKRELETTKNIVRCQIQCLTNTEGGRALKGRMVDEAMGCEEGGTLANRSTETGPIGTLNVKGGLIIFDIAG